MSCFIMAIDPSLGTIGVAVKDHQGKLLEGCLIKPSTKGLMAPLGQIYLKKLPLMLNELTSLVRAWKPIHIAIETPALHSANRVKGAEGHGLARYGFAAGAVWLEIQREWPGAQIWEYDAEVWTRGRRKEVRAAELALRCSMYRKVVEAKKDPGRDLADAIQLAEVCFDDIKRGE